MAFHGKMEVFKSHILPAQKEGMKEYSFAGVDDFGEVLNRLVMHAQNLNVGLVCAGARERVLPGGESAEDLAMTHPLLGQIRKGSQRRTKLSRI